MTEIERDWELMKFYMCGVLILSAIMLMLLATSAHSGEYETYEIVNAIYHTEGGENAKVPFGILSVSCKGYVECRRIAVNTVRNNKRRWEKYRATVKSPVSFIKFLAGRFAPVGAGNDPRGLNRNWESNLRWFLRNPRQIGH